jgi:hypothetical protein
MNAEELGAEPWRPCCGSCRMEAIDPKRSPIQCRACGAAWDGSEVLPDQPQHERNQRAVFLRTSAAGKLTLEFAPPLRTVAVVVSPSGRIVDVT